MPQPVSTSTYLEIAKIAQFLAGNDAANFVANPGGVIASNTSFLLLFARTGIQWQYDRDPTASTLPSANFYLKRLIGGYWNQASGIVGATSGTVITPGGDTELLWIYEQTVVTSGGQIEPDGTVWTLNYSGTIYNSIQVYVDGVEIPRNQGDRLSYVLTIQANTFTITFNQGLTDGNVVLVTGVYVSS